jgi:dATP pyrophosphohydrolase
MVARAPFQILVFPFRKTESGAFEFAVFQRSDTGWWQGIAGGGDEGESPFEAARREALEEAAIPPSLPFYPLQTTNSIPVSYFAARSLWPVGSYVIPEHAFGIDCSNHR